MLAQIAVMMIIMIMIAALWMVICEVIVRSTLIDIKAFVVASIEIEIYWK